MRQCTPDRREMGIWEGTLPSLDTADEREATLAAVRVGRYTDSSQGCVESHRRFVAKTLVKWHVTP